MAVSWVACLCIYTHTHTQPLRNAEVTTYECLTYILLPPAPGRHTAENKRAGEASSRPLPVCHTHLIGGSMAGKGGGAEAQVCRECGGHYVPSACKQPTWVDWCGAGMCCRVWGRASSIQGEDGLDKPGCCSRIPERGSNLITG